MTLLFGSFMIIYVVKVSWGIIKTHHLRYPNPNLKPNKNRRSRDEIVKKNNMLVASQKSLRRNIMYPLTSVKFNL